MNKVEGVRRTVKALRAVGAVLTIVGILAFLDGNPALLMLGIALLIVAWILSGFTQSQHTEPPR